MSAFGDFEHISAVATVDLTACQYRIVGIDGTLVGSDAMSLGVLINHPKSGESMHVGYMGHMKAFCAGTITLGAELMVTTSGCLLANVTSGAGIVGKAMKAASSGSLVEFIGNFVNAPTNVGGIA